jgi:hypothetical protein
MTLHRLLPDKNRWPVEKVRGSLRSGGADVIGDWVVSEEKERAYLEALQREAEIVPHAAEGVHPIDVSLSPASECRLLLEAGFPAADLIWQEDEAAVYVAAVSEGEWP